MTGKRVAVLIRSLLNHLELNPYDDIMYEDYRKALLIVLKIADKISDTLDIRDKWYNGIKNKTMTVIRGGQADKEEEVS